MTDPAQPEEEQRFHGLEDWLATFVGLALLAIVLLGVIPKGAVY